MKKSIFTFIFAAVFILISCDKDTEQDPVINSGLEGSWNLFQVTGGLAGVNCIYEPGESIWTFSNDQLIIVSNITNTEPICSGTGIGDNTQEYGVLAHNGKKFLLLDGFEAGELTISQDEFLLDQNSFSQGQGAY